MFFVWEYQTLNRFGQLEFGERFLLFAKPISDPRESLLVSGLHFLCPYLEVNRFLVILRRLRAVLSWLTPPPKLRTANCGPPKLL